MDVQSIGYLLLDFDGPICHVFAGFPAPEVARQLRDSLRDRTPPRWMVDNTDPHEVLRATGELGAEIAADANRKLTSLELRAVQSATPTPFTDDVVQAARAAGSKIAIVSNNARSAVIEYLSCHGLLSSIDYVSARASSDLSLMKPNPYLVIQAIRELKADTQRAALVGDQVSDVIAAHRAGIRAIGYANKGGKVKRFEGASADLVITSMAELLPPRGRRVD